MAEPPRRGWLPAAAADLFQELVDDQSRRHHGVGSAGQLDLLLSGLGRAQAADLTARFAALVARTGLDRLTWARHRGRPGWVLGDRRLPPPVALDLLPGDPARARLTWDHRLCDARGALALLAALDAGTTPALAPRELPRLPPTAAARGLLARGLPALLRAQRAPPAWRPLAAGANAALPLASARRIVAGTPLAALVARQRQAIDRFAELAFLGGALARALDRCANGPAGHPLVFAVTVDERPAGAPPVLANRHSLGLLHLPADGRATLGEAARGLRAAQRAWLARDGGLALAAGLGFTRFLPRRVVAAELGNSRSGVAASAVLSHVGRCPLGPLWCGLPLLGVDHLATIPADPGLALLASHDPRGLVLTVIAAGRVAGLLPPALLADTLVDVLLNEPLP